MTTPHQGQVAGTRWDPTQYLKFSDHRLRPALELLDRVPLESPKVAYDLGCGAGQIARLMAAKWPEAQVYGLDSSPDMIAQSARDPSRVNWVQADIRTWKPDRAPDLIYSNATLQWVEDHAQLFPRLVETLRPGGCLAVQLPLSWHMPSHRLMRDVLNELKLGTTALRVAVGSDWVGTSETYYDLLVGRVATLDIWEVDYLHVLEGEHPVLEWVKSTGLRPIFTGLEDGERDAFMAEYRSRLRALYPMRPNGRTLYPFRRLFIVATV